MRLLKFRSTARNFLQPQASTKIDCNANVNASTCLDGKFKLTTVVLEHDHRLSPTRALYQKSNKKKILMLKEGWAC